MIPRGAQTASLALPAFTMPQSLNSPVVTLYSSSLVFLPLLDIAKYGSPLIST